MLNNSLRSRGVAYERILCETTPEFGEGFVFDLRQVTSLEGRNATACDQCIECSDDFGIELPTLVPVQLIHRSIMVNRFSIDAIRGHRFISIRDDDDARTEWNRLASESIWITRAVIVFVVMHDQRDKR